MRNEDRFFVQRTKFMETLTEDDYWNPIEVLYRLLSLQSCSFMAYTVRPPSILISSIISWYFSYQHIFVCPSMWRLTELGNVNPSAFLNRLLRGVESLENLQAE